MTPEMRDVLVYVVVALCSVLGFWFVWSLMERFGADREPEDVALPWHEVLGIASDANGDEIRAGYERESSSLRLDRIPAMDPRSRAIAMAQARRLEHALVEALAEAASRNRG